MSERPDTRTVDQVDDFFGTEIADPYRWLEDSDDAEVVHWQQAQAAHTRHHLDTLPDPAPIVAALDRAVRLPHSGLPVHRGRALVPHQQRRRPAAGRAARVRRARSVLPAC